MDRNGFFFYATATAKKKKISLMQRPPRAEEPRRRPGAAQRVPARPTGSAAATAARLSRDPPAMQRPTRARQPTQVSQLESYQPRYHTIRDTQKEYECKSAKTVKKVRSDNGSPKHRGDREHQHGATNLRLVFESFVFVSELNLSWSFDFARSQCAEKRAELLFVFTENMHEKFLV